MLKRIVIGIMFLAGTAITGYVARELLPRAVVWQPTAKVFDEAGQHGAEFGDEVAIDGNTIAVGAWTYDIQDGKNPETARVYSAAGAVFVYERSGSTWVQGAKLICDNLRNGCLYFGGYGLAIDKDTIAVSTVQGSASPSDPGANGVVYVFTRQGSAWVQQAKLFPPPDAHVEFSKKIALDGDTLVVGDEGAAYVYVRDPKTAKWSHQAKLVSPVEDVFFGPAVAISGDTIVVGGAEFGGGTDVFVRAPDSQTWTHQANLKPTSTGFGAGASLGHAVAIEGDTILVGASSEPRDLGILFPCTGAAYVFTRDRKAQSWTQQARLVPRGVNLGINSYMSCNSYGFGSSVSLSGNTAVVGARAIIRPTSTTASTALIFQQDSQNQWQQRGRIAPEKRYGFIRSVGVSGHYVVVGDNVAGGKKDVAGEGAAYVLDLNTVNTR